MATINPFQGPINYSVDVQSPFEAALGGFKIGAAGAEIQAQQKKRDLEIKAAEQAQQRQTELADLFKNPNATSADYERVVAFLPKDQAAIVTGGFERKTKAQQETDLRMGAEVYSAIKSGQPNIAMQRLTDQAAAFRNSGRENDAKAAEASAKAIELNPTGAQTTVGLYMARLPGGIAYLEAADKALATIRAEAAAPAELREKLAKADKAEADALIAQEQAITEGEKQAAALKLAQAQADSAAVKAKYAEQEAQDEIKKRLADLNLTKAQTTKYKVETGNLSTTGKLLKLDFDAALLGLPLPSKNAGTTVATASEDERKAAGWLSQADNAYKNMLSAMYDKEGKRTGAEKTGFFEALPFVGGGGLTRGTERQKFVQAGASLSEALLRAATGAGQNENEAKQKIEELTPTYFDEPDTIKQKLAAIPMYLQSLQARAGRAAPKDYTVPSVPGVFVTTPNGQTIRFDNQNAADAFKKAAGIQ
jgi:hypothetical protein